MKEGVGGVLLALVAAALTGCEGSSDDVEDARRRDLAVVSVDAPDGGHDLIDTASISVSIRNYGPEDCASYDVAFYLSDDIFIGADDTLIGSEPRTDGLASGEEKSFSSTASWAGVTPGGYYVGMIVTADDDANAANNTAYDPYPIAINVGGLAADLQDRGDLYNDFTPASVEAGQAWSVSCDVENVGDADAGAFSVDFYASDDDTISRGDYLLGSVLVSGVPMGSFANVGLTLSLFPSMPTFPSIPSGTYYYVGWIIDPDGDVIEGDESNNRACEPVKTLAVSADCDLRVDLVDATDGTYSTTDSLSVSNSTFNIGPILCTSYTVNFYLSEDETITTDDILIGTESRTSVLDVSATDVNSNTVSWSGVTPDDYYVGMIVTCPADPVTSNNTGHDATPITIAEVDDVHEQDDNLVQADLQGDFSEVISFSGVSWDADYYRISVSSFSNQVDISLTFTHSAGNLDLDLLDSVGTVLASSTSVTDDESISLVVSPAGTHYIRVRPVGGATGNTYTLWWDGISPAGSDDNYEPNDYYWQAYDLSWRELTWLSSIAGPGIQADDDWYEISVSSGLQRVLVSCTFSHSGGDIDIALYNSFGGTFTPVSGSRSSTGVVDNEYINCWVPTSGTYYIRVYLGNGGNTYDLWWDDVSP